MRRFHALLAALLLAAVPGLAAAAPAGTALGVNPKSGAALDGVERLLVVGSDIFRGDLVQTSPRGQVQILFDDKTELVIGPSSKLRIDDYLIRNDGSAGKLAVDMLGGAFRFATGNSAKDRYTITTPTGTIGIRGTEFDVWVAPDTGDTYILRHGGTIEFCTKAGDCKVLTDTCEVGVISAKDTQVLGDSRDSRGTFRQQLKGWFFYSDNQRPLLRQFWFPEARDCLNRDAPPAPYTNPDQPQVPGPTKPGTPPTTPGRLDDPTGGPFPCTFQCIQGP